MSSSRRLSIFTLLALLLFGVTVVAACRLYVVLSQERTGTAPLLRWHASGMRLVQGVGTVDDSGVTLTGTSDEKRALAVFADVGLDAGKYALVSWEMGALPSGGELFMVWRCSDDARKWFMKPFGMVKRGVATVYLRGDAHWRGDVSDIGVMFKGSMRGTWGIHGAMLEPISIATEWRGLSGDWTTFEPWGDSSINFVHGGAPEARFSWLLFLSSSLAVAVVAALVLARGARAAAVGTLVVTAWLLVDARWQWNLWQQLGITLAQYSGKSWQGKQLAAPDGELFRFIENVKKRLPPPPVRVLYFAGDPYLNARGNYHLYPYNVFAYNYGQTGAVPAARRFHVGDYVVLYRVDTIRYDVSKHLMIWDAGQRRAELVYASGGNLLLRVY